MCFPFVVILRRRRLWQSDANISRGGDVRDFRRHLWNTGERGNYKFSLQRTMESMPEDLLARMFQCLRDVQDRNNVASVCRRWYDTERELRTELSVGCGMNPPESAITALTTRFSNLCKVEISYPRWLSNMGRQVDDRTLELLSKHCLQLSDLSLNFCGFITDVGMGNLTFCKRLKSVRLNFLPCVTGRGLLSLVSGCRNLTLFHIERLMSVRTVEWLEFLGRKGKIKSLAVKNCKCVGDYELGRLRRRGWENLQEVFFEVDLIHGLTGNVFGYNGREASLLNAWSMENGSGECCPNLRVLSLTKTLSASGTGLNWLLSQSSSLSQLHLDTCVGLEDEDLFLLAQNCSQLCSLYLRAPIRLPSPDPPRLTDAGLLAVAQFCRGIETLELSFCESDLNPFFSSAGISAMVENSLKLKKFIISAALPFTDEVMSVVCRSESVESLEVVECNEVSDAGLRMIKYSALKELKVRRCYQLTNAGFTPDNCSRRLKYITVEDCPHITREGLVDVAQVVSYDGSHIHRAMTF